MIFMFKLLEKSITTLKQQGVKIFIIKAKNYIFSRTLGKNNSSYCTNQTKVFADVLFINGCTLPHPSRYRVNHQREQLFANNVTNNEIFYEDLTLDLIKYYRCFIFFRCPITSIIEEFIETSKKQNKTVLFDIDDLVIDSVYTNEIKYLDNLSIEEKKEYDNGVTRIRETLILCDSVITTTTALAEELKKYNSEVFINRNVASMEMVRISEEANFKHFDLQYLSEDKLSKLEINEKRMIIKENNIRNGQVRIGYFSGSITHNDDFNMIFPTILQILEENENVELYLIGELTIPKELLKFKKRILVKPFLDWHLLPDLLASVDIVLAPLLDTVFNRAKSENKWLEAALVKTITVASNCGAFKEMVVHGVTGILCNDCNEWYKNLSELISNKDKRTQIGYNAYCYVINNCTTGSTGLHLSNYLKKKMSKNIVFVLPSVQTSGGVLVVFKHCSILKKSGFDVTIFSETIGSEDVTYIDDVINVISTKEIQVHGSIDKCVATLWTTVRFLNTFPNIKERFYLVQNFEPNFYKPGDPNKLYANQTYTSVVDLSYITISKWCQKWLNEKYNQSCKYAPNGIDLSHFKFKYRNFNEKIRILIEGNSNDFYKNVDESFKIVEGLDKNKFEIWYLSYEGKPKKWYHVDKFFHQVPYAKVAQIYQSCHILLKSSILESFSYPPLEMMATGGISIVRPNEGNVEYLIHNVNCIFYNPDKLEEAQKLVEDIVKNKAKIDMLIENGIKTVKERDWGLLETAILDLYTEERVMHERN